MPKPKKQFPKNARIWIAQVLADGHPNPEAVMEWYDSHPADLESAYQTAKAYAP